MNNKSVEASRQMNMDLLRILAAISVVILHVSASYCAIWNSGSDSIIANIYDACFRFGVPIFVMISGRFFLSSEGDADVRGLWKKNIFKLVIVYVVWSLFYALTSIDFTSFRFLNLIKTVIVGKYHLWYIPMLIGIYMIIPVLKAFVDKSEKKLIEYFLVIFFILQIVGETLKAFNHSEIIALILDKTEVELFSGYIGYFVLGFYLYKYPLNRRKRMFSFMLGGIGLIGAAGLSTYWAILYNHGYSAIYDSFSVFTFFVSVAIYVLFQDCVKCEYKEKSVISLVVKEITRDTLGLYLIQIYLLEFAIRKWWNVIPIPMLVFIPIASSIIIVVGLIISALIRRIPFVGKYIV